MKILIHSRRSFVKTLVALVGTTLLARDRLQAQPGEDAKPLIDPTGQFFYCCNQRGDNIATFRVDRKTGGLDFTGHYTPVGNPSTIVFLDLAKVR